MAAAKFCDISKDGHGYTDTDENQCHLEVEPAGEDKYLSRSFGEQQAENKTIDMEVIELEHIAVDYSHQ